MTENERHLILYGHGCQHRIRPCSWRFPWEWFHSKAVVKCQLSSLFMSRFASSNTAVRSLLTVSERKWLTSETTQNSPSITFLTCGERKRHRLDSWLWNLQQKPFHWTLPQGNSTLNCEFSCPTRHTMKVTDLLGTKREEIGRFVQFLPWVLGLWVAAWVTEDESQKGMESSGFLRERCDSLKSKH